MRAAGISWCVVGLALFAAPLSVRGQLVLRGRVEDASARTPIAGARVVAPDSTAVFTDSLGVFSIVVPEGDSLFVRVAQYGYIFQRFDLPPEAPSRLSVLLLEPDAIELEGIDVVAESSVDRLLNSLRSRRNASPTPVQAFDRARLDELAPAGSVWDFVSTRSRMRECDAFPRTRFGNGGQTLQEWWRARSGLCGPGGGAVLVCIDGWDSWAAISELSSMDIRSVALVEIFGGRRGGAIRVYTARYLLSVASKGNTLYFDNSNGC
ncbi:MAG: hypothetical protein AB7T31_07955 [Gemmatimonadales bacterium]